MPLLPSTDQALRCLGFCDCRFPSCIDVANHKGYIPDLVTCRCGEDAGNGLQWQWHKTEDSDAQIADRDIIFHPTYSQGTSIVRGERPLQHDKVHFWEMRVITALAGTDVVSCVTFRDQNSRQISDIYTQIRRAVTQSGNEEINRLRCA